MEEKSNNSVKIWNTQDNKLRITADYGLFKQLPYNRDIDHEKQLISSIQKVGFVPVPVVVNEKMEIIDGQHRFSACKALSLPVHYIVVPGIGLKECSEMNSVSKNWSTMNHVHAYTSPVYEDNDSYIYYELLTEENKDVSPTMMSCVLAPLLKTSGRKVRKIIRDGELTISEHDYQHTQEKIAWVRGFIPYAKKLEGVMETFWESVSYLYEIKAVNNERLKQRILQTDPADLSPVGRMNSFLDALEGVYNKNSKKNKVYMRPEYDAYIAGQ